MNAKTKTITIFAALFLLLAMQISFATVYVNNNFVEAKYDLNNNLIISQAPVTNVNVIGFVCANSDCSQVSGQIFDGQTLRSGSSSSLQTYFPTVAQYAGNNNYAVFYYKDGYIAAENNPSYYGTGTVGQTFDRPLTKIEVCRAPIDTFSVINDVYPNEPIMVDITTSADATVRNIFGQQGPIAYVPPVIEALHNLNVRVTLQISNRAGQVINTQQKDVTLRPDGSVRVQFDFTPTTIDRYTAKVSTEVVDNKCMSSDKEYSEKNFNVIAQGPTEMCYTLLNNLALNPFVLTQNQQTTISFDKITNYYDENSNLYSLPTQATISVLKDGQVEYTKVLNIAANANIVNPQVVTSSFTTTTAGYHTLTVSANTVNCPYNNKIADTASLDFYVSGTVTPPQNSPPQWTQLPAVSMTYNQGTSTDIFNLKNYAFDTDGDALTFSQVSQSDTSAITCSLSTSAGVTCTTRQDRIGCSTVTVRAFDGKVNSDTNYQACVLAPNRAPIFNALPSVTLPTVSGSYFYSVRLTDFASDPDGQPLTFAIASQTNTVPVICNIDVSGFLGCTGDRLKTGYSDIRVVASDGSLSASQAFRITVNPGGVGTGLTLSGIPDITVQPNSGLNQNLIYLSQFTSNPQNRAITYRVLSETNRAAANCALTISNTVNCNVAPGVENQYSDVTLEVNDGITASSDTFRVSISSIPTPTTLNCTGPYGEKIVHGASGTYYAQILVSYGQNCMSEQRVCNNGVLSGTYQYNSCTVNLPQSCLAPTGVRMAHGATVNFFQSMSVPSGQSCTSEPRTCNNGALSGSYQYASCSVQPPQPSSCVGPDSSVISHTYSKTYFATNSVSFGQSCTSESRVCNNGALSGSYQYASCTPQGQSNCVGPNGVTIFGGSSATYFQSSSVPFGQSCTSEQRVCNNGALSGSYQYSACVVLPQENSGCIGPDLSLIAHTGSKIYYASPSVAFGQICASEPRVCNNGVLSGSYFFSSCTPQPQSNCVGPNGETIIGGYSATFFQSGSVPYGQSCTSEQRVCSNGYLSGTFTYNSCNVMPRPLANCVGPNGVTIVSGSSATYFLSSSVPFGQNCASEQRVCYDGTLSGSYIAPTCSVQPAASCVGPNGVTIASGSSATFFQSTTVPFGQVCSSEQRVCNNGALSGSFSASSCSVLPGASCIGPNGATIASGSSAIFFQSTTVPFGQVCSSEQRVCNNGALSGSFSASTCSVLPGASCVGPNGVTIASGSSATFYQAPLVVAGFNCQSESRMCTNGALSGSFTFNSCIIGINTAPVWLQVPSLSILRNAGYGSLNLQNYVFDAQAPPQILQFGIDYATMAARNPNPPFTCKIASGSSMLECFPNHGQDAKTTYYVYVTDGIETVTTPVEVTVGINMVPSREKNNDGLMIMQFIVPEFSEGELARGTLPISVGLKNDGSRLDDVIVKATVLEFGSSAKVGPFDLGAEAKNVQLYIPLDMSVRAGIYTVRLTITDTDTGLNRIEHRDLVVYPGR